MAEESNTRFGSFRFRRKEGHPMRGSGLLSSWDCWRPWLGFPLESLRTAEGGKSSVTWSQKSRSANAGWLGSWRNIKPRSASGIATLLLALAAGS